MIAHKHEANYVVLGSSGTKGEQEDPYRIGKTAMHMLENSKVPLILIKKPYQRLKNETKGYNFLIAFDGSKSSMHMIAFAKDLARNSNDRIYAAHVNEEGSLAKEEMEQNFKDAADAA